MWTHSQQNRNAKERGHALAALLVFLLAFSPISVAGQAGRQLYSTVLCATHRVLSSVPGINGSAKPEICPRTVIAQQQAKLAPVKEFLQTRKEEERSAVQRTKAYLAHDEEGLHIILEAYDQETHKTQGLLDLTIAYRDGGLQTSLRAQLPA
jgi:hypothetical protein